MKYSTEIERDMKAFYDSLSENVRCRYAALEAAKLGHGGTDYIATVLDCDPKTIRHGQHELAGAPQIPIRSGSDRPTARIRLRGDPKAGGRTQAVPRYNPAVGGELPARAAGLHRGRPDAWTTSDGPI